MVNNYLKLSTGVILNILFVFIVFIFFFNFKYASATQGACSYHGGVNCSAGASYTGKVQCNDGWINSSVYFFQADECKDTSSCPVYTQDEIFFNKYKKDIADKINQIKTTTENNCESSYQASESINEQNYQSCMSSMQSLLRISGGVGSIPFGDCEDEKTRTTQSNQAQKGLCLYGSDDIIYKYERLSVCLFLDKTDYCSLIIPNSHTENKECVCNGGYKFNSTESGCELPPTCSANSSLGSDNKCYCNDGYGQDVNSGGACITYDQSCQNKYGPYAFYRESSGYCLCSSGYFDATKNTCVVEEVKIDKPESVTTITSEKIKTDNVIAKNKSEIKKEINTSKANQEQNDKKDETFLNKVVIKDIKKEDSSEIKNTEIKSKEEIQEPDQSNRNFIKNTFTSIKNIFQKSFKWFKDGVFRSRSFNIDK